jgi:hypothetical protein
MGARLARRELLCWSALLVAGRPWFGLLSSRPAADEVQDLVQWIRTTPREPALARGARELRAGLDPARLLGALLLASAREIRTDLPRFNHAALSVSAIDQLARSAPAAERQRTALWCLDYFKEAQRPSPARTIGACRRSTRSGFPGVRAARAALVDALERWDRDAADAAIAGWVRSAPLDEVFDLLFEYGTRCAANLGHKAIYAALARRALPLLGEPYAEDVLRSVVASFFLDGPTPAAAPFERAARSSARGSPARAAARGGPGAGQRAPGGAAPLRARGAAAGGRAPDRGRRSAAFPVGRGRGGGGGGHGGEPRHREPARFDLGQRAAPHRARGRGPRLALLALLQAAAWGARFRRCARRGPAGLSVGRRGAGAVERGRAAPSRGGERAARAGGAVAGRRGTACT